MALRVIVNLGAIVGLSVLLNGCVLSLEPVVDETDAIFDPRLIGTWQISGSEIAVVTRSTGNAYTVKYTTNDKTATFEAQLALLGDHTILDVRPVLHGGELPEPYDGLLIAGHLILDLDIGPEEIRTSAIGLDSLLAALETGEVNVPYSRSQNQLILSGETRVLRPALESYLARNNALVDLSVWRRAADQETTVDLVPPEAPCFGASPWPEADLLFHGDPRWLGSDVASTVDLGDRRILWLFGDSWIDPKAIGTRRGATLVSNSVAIQTGKDPTAASMSFSWGTGPDGQPTAYFPDRDGESLWPGNGVRVGDRLVVFLARTVRGVGNGLGFEHAGWTAIMVDNPKADPSSWHVHPLETPENPLGILVGFAAVLQTDGYVYALGSQNPIKTHPVFAARWPADDVQRGDLLHPEWWAGDRNGWVPDSSNTPRWPLVEDGASELSVHLDSVTHRFVMVQTQSFGPADLMMRDAPGLTGPWSPTRIVFRPAEFDRPNIMIYAAKAHPHLTGADLVLTYATNTFRFAEQLTDSQIYYPHFVRLTRCLSD